MGYVNKQQQATLIALSVISSSLSIAGSFVILRCTVRNYKESCRLHRSGGRKTTANAFAPTYMRIMFAMSCFDIIYSLNLVFQPLAVYGYPLSFGNVASCTAVGSIHQMGFAGFMYYGMLSFYFLLTIRKGKSQEWVAKKAEPFMHTIAIGFPLITSITGVIIDCYAWLDLFVGCWVANYPKGCQYPSNPLQCSTLPGYLFGGVPFAVLIPSLTVNNTLVFLHVRKVYKSSPSTLAGSSRGSLGGAMDDQQKKRIRQVGTQATLYVAAAFLTYMPLIINELVLTVILGLYRSTQSDIIGKNTNRR